MWKACYCVDENASIDLLLTHGEANKHVRHVLPAERRMCRKQIIPGIDRTITTLPMRQSVHFVRPRLERDRTSVALPSTAILDRLPDTYQLDEFVDRCPFTAI